MSVAERSARWLEWMGAVRARHLACPFGNATVDVRWFHAAHWTLHHPAHLRRAFAGPALGWTLESLAEFLPPDLHVEVQADRLDHADYERRSPALKRTMLWREFLDRVRHAEGNSVYLTANNSCPTPPETVLVQVAQKAIQGASLDWIGRRPREIADAICRAVGEALDAITPAENQALIARLWDDLGPHLPAMIRPEPGQSFLWLGRDTRTPLHHDMTDNALLQLVGTRLVRLVAPSQQPLLEHRAHVHSDLGWLDTSTAIARGIEFADYRLSPGDLLFVPVGWWHCVQAEGVSCMLSTTAFWWPNHWEEGYP